MSKNNDLIMKELKKIQCLLAGILLNKKTDLKKVAKIIGVSDKTLTKFYPERKAKKKK